tara:strand:+ start:11834 stop:13591 length:1758 start_codon:yes stop_codon:yes gene_type:complete
MCDKLVFDLSQEVEGSPSVFVKKDWLNILDNQNSNYNSNQSVIDTSQLSNSNKWLSYREAYLSVPMLLSVATTNLATAGGFAPATDGTSADYSLGLKNWFGQIIHSLTLDYNGTTIIQQTPWCNMWNSFKLMTSLSLGDVETQGATIGFFPDDPLSWTFIGSAGVSTEGSGVCNNTNQPSTGNLTIFNRYRQTEGNDGFLKRQRCINYDPDATAGVNVGGAGLNTFGSLMSASTTSQVWKSYISQKTNGANAGNQGVFAISIQATIYLKHLHSFFAMCPLLKGAYMKMTLNLNNTSTSFTATDDGAGNNTDITLVGTSNAVGGVCPLMIASGKALNGSSKAILAGSYTANLSVGAKCLDPTISASVNDGQVGRSIYLYVPSYTFNPVFEMSYLSSPIKSIQYTDIYQYQVLKVGGASGQINNLITNGIANIKSILVIPFFSTGTANSGLPTGMPVYQSPFDPAGCCATSPLTGLTNFNVVVSGQNTIYNTQRYAFEEFNNQFYGVNAVNGGMTDGLTSGLIDRLGFDMEYSYYYVDLSRMLPVEESVPKSVQLVGQNTSQKELDFWVFIEYGVSVDIDALTGVRT